MQFEEKITKQVNEISEGWNSFKYEYNGIKSQLSELQTAINRPLLEFSANGLEKKACSDYLRKGEVSLELKNFSSSVDSGGGLIAKAL